MRIIRPATPTDAPITISPAQPVIDEAALAMGEMFRIMRESPDLIQPPELRQSFDWYQTAVRAELDAEECKPGFASES